MPLAWIFYFSFRGVTMKKFFLISACALLAACTSTKVSESEESFYGPGFGIQPFRITKMIYLSADAKNQDKPCSMQLFYSRYVGKNLSKGSVSIRIDDIRNAVMITKTHNEQKRTIAFFFSNTRDRSKYTCHYEGYGVEYDLSDVQILNVNADDMQSRKIPAVEDEF